jgi:predicted ArsR family transcriptional regulator|tara:strand:- start:159 stop:374 length:216 start_codon:yes stop_codon:yes gene_type:complete
MLVTCKQLSEILGVEYLQASSIMKVLTTKGVATESSTIKQKNRGRPTIVYEIPNITTIDLVRGIITGDNDV